MPVTNILKQSMLLIAGAFAGGLFVLLLPTAWIVVGLFMLAKMLVNRMVLVADRNAGFGWRPLQGYLAGRKAKNKSGT